MLRGQEISLGSELWACSSCILESGRHWCGARVEKPPSWPGSLQGISSPFSAAFSPCLIPLSTMEVQSPRLRHAPSPPLAKRFPPAGPWAGAGTGQEGPHSPRTGTCLHAALSPPAAGRTQPWVHTTFLFPNSSAASGSQKPRLWHRYSSLCCRKPWFGILGGGVQGHRRSPGSHPGCCRWSWALRHFCCCPPKPH